MFRRGAERYDGEGVEAIAAALASKQLGAFTREQLLRRGVSDDQMSRRVRAGAWRRVSPGVYRLAGAPAAWEAELLAACLSCGGSAIVSHRSAAVLWRIADIPQGPFELTVPTHRSARSGVILHRAELAPVDRTRIGLFPVTTPARTLIDLAAVVDRATLERALDDALRNRLVSLEKIERRVAELGARGRAGLRTLRRVVAERRCAPTESELERRFLRLLRRARLPEPVVQYAVRVGGRRMRIDFAYPDRMLAIETDGYRWHSDRQAWESDLARRNALTAAGWTVIHVTWRDIVERPAEVADLLRLVITQS